MRSLGWGLAAAAAVASGAAWAAAPAPRTVVSAPAVIAGAAQDGGRIAWFSRCTGVRVRELSSGRDLVTGERRTGPCEFPVNAFVLGAGRVLWISTSPGNNTYSQVTSAVPGEPHARDHGLVIGTTLVNAGDYLAGAAGSGSLLVYSVLTRSTSDGCLNPEETSEPCEYGVSGRVIRIVGRKGVRVPGVPPAAHLAAGAGRIAIVTVAPLAPRDVLDQTGVEVRNGFSGRLVTRVAPTGEVEKLALSGTVLALLVREGGVLSLERYGLPTGRRLGSIRVPGNATNLSVAGARVVFRTGSAIRLLDAASGRTRVVARSPSPLSVSIVGRRVIWVEGRRVLAVAV